MSKIIAEQIEKWKKEYPEGVFRITSTDKKKGYIKAPDRETLSYATSFLPQDKLGYADTILQSCWIGGDEALKTETKYLLGIAPQIDEAIEYVEAEIKKL
ncbi:hypothetical protein PL373_07930 [Tenacibaculum maritimum]|nr:hypothetical protein [Tenacibaculum maritimum]MDB0601074.1 hypothetical protein [Tenacibaculum maritimum]MDB0612155.1 hypothetical protein [Tenacibaculum maritimum]